MLCNKDEDPNTYLNPNWSKIWISHNGLIICVIQAPNRKERRRILQRFKQDWKKDGFCDVKDLDISTVKNGMWSYEANQKWPEDYMDDEEHD
jgi:hypothetical protein